MALTHPFSMQVYSARKFPPHAAQLATMAKHGFTNVELHAAFYEDLAETKALLAQYGLTSASGHFSLALAEESPRRVVEIAHALGMKNIVIPYLMPDERPNDRAGWQALGARLNKLSDIFSPDGFHFAWHNHDFEFAPLSDGSLPIEHVLGDRLLWEADLAWVVRGKADARHWLRRYAGRVPLVHVKDIAPAGEKADEDGWADVGRGTMGWQDLWPAAVAAGAEVMIAEHDNPSDFDRFASNSAASMKNYANGAKS
jgi:sugar phosphate isomerase/epimerase